MGICDMWCVRVCMYGCVRICVPHLRDGCDGFDASMCVRTCIWACRTSVSAHLHEHVFVDVCVRHMYHTIHIITTLDIHNALVHVGFTIAIASIMCARVSRLMTTVGGARCDVTTWGRSHLAVLRDRPTCFVNYWRCHTMKSRQANTRQALGTRLYGLVINGMVCAAGLTRPASIESDKWRNVIILYIPIIINWIMTIVSVGQIVSKTNSTWPSQMTTPCMTLTNDNSVYDPHKWRHSGWPSQMMTTPHYRWHNKWYYRVMKTDLTPSTRDDSTWPSVVIPQNVTYTGDDTIRDIHRWYHTWHTQETIPYVTYTGDDTIVTYTDDTIRDIHRRRYHTWHTQETTPYVTYTGDDTIRDIHMRRHHTWHTQETIPYVTYTGDDPIRDIRMRRHHTWHTQETTP